MNWADLEYVSSLKPQMPRGDSSSSSSSDNGNSNSNPLCAFLNKRRNLRQQMRGDPDDDSDDEISMFPEDNTTNMFLNERRKRRQQMRGDDILDDIVPDNNSDDAAVGSASTSNKFPRIGSHIRRPRARGRVTDGAGDDMISLDDNSDNEADGSAPTSKTGFFPEGAPSFRRVARARAGRTQRSSRDPLDSFEGLGTSDQGSSKTGQKKAKGANVHDDLSLEPDKPNNKQQKLSGRGEIEAAKRTLAMAKKWEASSMSNVTKSREQVKHIEEQLKTAKGQLQDSQVQANEAKTQVGEAEAYLKSIEQRWEVIDVDDDAP